MPKTIGLEQLSKKKYTLVPGLSPDVQASIGEIEDAFDAIIYGESGNGKTNFTVMLLKSLIKAMSCTCEYISYEEGHGKTVQDTMIARHNMLAEIGNKMKITECLSYAELAQKMGKKQSAKIWVIDSIQAADITYRQFAELKKKYVLGKKRKIIIALSWADGSKPQGAAAKSIEYYANIKMRVEGLVVFPKSRYGGNKPYIVWEEGAKQYWQEKFYKVTKTQRPKKANKKEIVHPETEPV